MIKSASQCSSEFGYHFLAILIVSNVISLLIALILCYQTRHIHSDFAESGNIFLVVMFLFQVLVVSVPLAGLVRNDVSEQFSDSNLPMYLISFITLL